MEAAHPKYRRWSYWNIGIVNTHLICKSDKILLAWMGSFLGRLVTTAEDSCVLGCQVVPQFQMFWRKYVPSKFQDVLYITETRQTSTTEKYSIYKETKNGTKTNNKSVMKNKQFNIPVQYEKRQDSSVVPRQHENITIPNDTRHFLDSDEG
jgi:hypothetical protein